MNITEKLSELRAKDPGFRAFGAGAFQYQVLPPLSEAEVAEVEAQYGVRLPEEYRHFLTEVGAGGAGPSYGVFPLVKEDGEWFWDGDGGDLTGDLTIPFPHVEAWSLDGHPIWDSYPEDDENFDELYDAWWDEFTGIYWAPEWTTGAICLCHHGCAARSWLVVTGPSRGQIWEDGRADEVGLYPALDQDEKPHTFLTWYGAWIESLLSNPEV